MKKPFAIYLTDVHLTKDNTALVRNIFKQAIAKCKKLGINTIFCGGDIFTNRQAQPLGALLAFIDILELLLKENIVLYSIPGNHDKTDLDADVSYLDVYKAFSNFRVFQNSSSGIFDKDKLVRVFFVPYFKPEKYLKELTEAVKNVKKDKVNFLITHIGVDGVKNNDGSLVDNGIPANLFSVFDKVLIGHYHDASKLGKNVYYTGSCYQANFGENIDDKGFTILYTDGSIEHVKTAFPRFIKVKLEASDISNIENSIELYTSEKFKEDKVRFIFNGKKENIDLVKANANQFKEKGIDVKYEADEIVENVENVENGEFVEFNRKSIVKDFNDYCKFNKIPVSEMVWALKIFNQKIGN